MQELATIFIYFDLLPILTAVFFIKKIKEQSIWAIIIYCTYSFINNQAIAYRGAHKLGYQNLYYYFTLFEYILFSFLLIKVINSKVAKKIIVFIAPLFTLFCIYFILRGNLTGFDSKQTSIECVIIIFGCLYYFYEQLVSPEVEFLYSNYKFWIIIALLIYLSGSFFIFVFAADLPKKDADSFWPIIYIAAIVRNILFAIAVYLSTRPQDEEPYQSLI